MRRKRKANTVVATPGNYEYLGFEGDKDDEMVFPSNSGDNFNSKILRTKLRGLRVLADIQSYYLGQFIKNNEEKIL